MKLSKTEEKKFCRWMQKHKNENPAYITRENRIARSLINILNNNLMIVDERFAAQSICVYLVIYNEISGHDTNCGFSDWINYAIDLVKKMKVKNDKR